MEPALHIGDAILVSTGSSPLERGAVIVISRPPTDTAPGVTDLVVRVIGLPGETISATNGQLYINGHSLNERWLPEGDYTPSFGPVLIPTDDYFVMGDNRGDSADSRIFGPISDRLVVGVALGH
jgi:signal peptidase I